MNEIDFTEWTDAQLYEGQVLADRSPSGPALLAEIDRRRAAGTWLKALELLTAELGTTDEGDREIAARDGFPLTVGQLREVLADLPADLQVVADDGDGWYVNVPVVIVPAPDGAGSFSAVTLVRGGPIDSRQF